MESSRLLEQINTFAGKLPHQKMSKIATVLLVVYCAYILAGLIWQLVPVTSNHGSININHTSSEANQAVNVDNIDISTLLGLNIFGDLKKSAITKPKPKSDKQAPKTRLNVRLTGLVADSSNATSATSVAIIENGGNQHTYGVDEKIHGTTASVHEILIDRVILYVSGRFETLMLDGIEYSTTVPGSDNKVDERALPSNITGPRKDKTISKKQQLDKRDNIALSESLRQQRKQLFEDPKKLLDVIRIKPFRQSGQLKGYKLSPGKEGKLFKEVGLKRNDLATNINGYDLTDMQQALTVMKELRSMTEATITVVRGDTAIDIILAL